MTYSRGFYEVIPPMVTPFTLGWTLYGHERVSTQEPASVSFESANRAAYHPILVPTTCVPKRLFWVNGTTVSTSVFADVGIYYDNGFKPGKLLRNSGPRAEGTANQVQFITPSVSTRLLTSGSSATNQDTYSTASVTLSAGKLYIIAFTNGHASSAPVASTIQTNGGAVSFTSRVSTQYESSQKRVSAWSAVPTSDVTATIDIDFGSSSGVTGCLWTVLECREVDTTTNHGIVQSASNTGTSTTPTATLSSFGSSRNSTITVTSTQNGYLSTPSASYYEFADTNAADPGVSFAIHEYAGEATSPSPNTYASSTGWACLALEVKAGPETIPNLTPGLWWIGLAATSISATFFRTAASSSSTDASFRMQEANGFPLPVMATPVEANTVDIHLAGFSTRA